MPNCNQCKSPFEITDEDRKFYERVSPVIGGKKFQIPQPTLCPLCRHQRRIVWRNERFLYRDKCGLCGKSIITMYPPESKFPIYCPDCFWSDKWNPLDYGRDFDFNRPFFSQFKDLLDTVPQLSIFQANSVNSEYTINSINNKNCYLTSGADYNEDCMYGINTQRSKDCVDHYLIYDSELCYGCIDSSRLHNCVGCQECENCSDCWFLYDCKGCRNCAFSANLRNKEYVIFNKPVNKEEYQEKLKQAFEHLYENPNWLFDTLQKVRNNAIHRANLILSSVDCSGNNIRNCKNSKFIFDAETLEDCRYCFYALDTKNSYDLSCAGWGSGATYEIISTAHNYETYFSTALINGNNIFYCRCLWNSHNAFGSTSLHSQNNFVILNKQYSKEEYENLVAKIIGHMMQTKEWGEFFPPSLSPFPYNKSMLIDYLPISKEEALKKGFRWSDEDEAKTAKPASYKLPNTIASVPDSVEDEVLTCENCKFNYRIIDQELRFHRKMHLPLSRLCWPCRLKNLIKARKPMKLFESACKKCGTKILTPYSPDTSLKVYCEKCYLETVY